MRILSITAGAAGMYCGSCFRDNALAIELLAQGQDITLLPVYTPTRTDETNVSQDRVLFGGVSVYLQHRFSMFRRIPRALDRLWDAPAVIRALTSRATSTDPRLLGDLTISTLEGRNGTLRKEFDKLVDWIRSEPLPDVINLPNSLLISMAGPLREAFGRPVCCTLQGEELFLDGLLPEYRSQALALMRRQVPDVDRFIAVSDYCGAFMGKLLAIPSDRMAVVPLGIRMDDYARPSRHGDPFVVGYFARVAPEKGLHVLVDAYVRFRGRVGNAPTRLEAAGYMSSTARPYLDQAREMMSRAGLSAEFLYRGELDRDAKLAFLRGLHVLSVPATYDEPKGMFLLEAMAGGVPVVQPRRGAFTEIVERTGGGLLVEPDNPQSLADGLYSLWRDREYTAALADRAYAGVREHYTIAKSARQLLTVYSELMGPGRSNPTGSPRRD